MTHNGRQKTRPETMVERRVSYTLEVQGNDTLIVVENVPARVCLETGGAVFLEPETVEKLQQMAWGKLQPKRTIQTPVYDFSEGLIIR